MRLSGDSALQARTGARAAFEKATPERAALPRPSVPDVRLSDVVAALSVALDITEGQPEGHAVRSCLIGMRLAEALSLDGEQRSSLFYALLLKDLGCSSNSARVAQLFGADDLAAKRDFKTTDWTRIGAKLGYVARHALPKAPAWRRALRIATVVLRGTRHGRKNVAIRCERGAQIASHIGFTEATADAIRALDEHWDGQGHPRGLEGDAIPLLARIACLAQTVEVFAAAHGPAVAMAMAEVRAGTWFDPRLVAVLATFADDHGFWDFVAHGTLTPELSRMEPAGHVLPADEAALDRIATAFAQVIDAKSPWTHAHSQRTAHVAVEIARAAGFEVEALASLKRAALLHDLGKLGVSSLILDKAGPLTESERADMRKHPEHTRRILERVPAFEGVACCAGNHHERMDGRGYPRGLAAADLTLPDRILAVADVYEALSADRPYRKGWSHERILEHLAKSTAGHLCPDCVGLVRTLDAERLRAAP